MLPVSSDIKSQLLLSMHLQRKATCSSIDFLSRVFDLVESYISSDLLGRAIVCFGHDLASAMALCGAVKLKIYCVEIAI